MANTPYPLPRQTRESTIQVGNGTAGPYGPSLYRVFDVEDVRVYLQAEGEESFTDVTASCTVTKTSGAGYDTFSVTFDQPVPATTRWYHAAKRVSNRSIAVTRAGTLVSDELEKELSKQASALSELRRDVDRGGSRSPGRPGQTLVFADDGTVRPGADQSDIEEAEENAAIAREEKEAAVEAKIAAESAAGANLANVDSRSAAMITTIPGPVNYMRTAGYTSAGDGGAALYRRGDGSRPGGFFSADGAGWEIIDDVPSATQFGATRNNFDDDAPSIQGAHDLASGGVHLPVGTYKMVPGPVSSFTLGNQPNNIYRAVALTADNITFSGQEAVLHGVSRPGVIAADVQPIFSTDKNMVVGTRKNISFDGVGFDAANDADAANSNQRFGYFVGVDGLRFLDTQGFSSGNRRGYFAHIQNSENVQVNGHRHQKMTGGFNVRYVDSFVLTNFIFDDFSEAIDLDGTSQRAIIRSGVFKSTSRVNQCIDVNDQVDASIGDFSVFNVGNIVTVNYKTTTPDTYAEYVANSLVRNFQVGKRIIISNISGEKVGSVTHPAFFIGWDWSSGNHAGAGPVRDITLQNITLDDHGSFLVREATNLKLKGIASYRAVSMYNHAVHCFSATSNADQIGWSDLDIDIDDVRIEASDKGGLYISTPSRARVQGLVTKGNNTLGGALTDLTITSLHTRAGRVSVDACDVEGNVNLNGDSTAIAAWAANTMYKRNAIVSNGGNFYRATTEGRSAAAGGPSGTAAAITDDGSASIAAWAGSTAYAVDDVVLNGGAYFICMTAGTSAISGGPAGTDQRIADGTAVWRSINGAVKWEYLLYPYSVRWGKNNRVKGVVTFEGDVQKYVFGESVSIELGDYAATGVINKSVLATRRRGRIARISYHVTADVLADPVNYRNLILRRLRAGVSTNVSTIDTTTSGLAAFTLRDGAVASNSAGADIEPGDVFYLNSNSSGAGRALSGLAITVDFIEY